MKLRNKISGDVGEFRVQLGCPVEGIKYSVVVCGMISYNYDSLAKLNEEWEDYEEPKKDFWFIDDEGDVEVEGEDNEENLDKMKQIGNYFETKEEAEKAVEKLLALKRLKDKGFKFKEWKFTPDMKHIKGNFVEIEAEIPYIVENQADLDLLFGGEDE